MTELLVGVDVGTTSAKAAVVTPDGEELAHGRAPMPWTAVPTGAEMSPEALVDTALAAVADALDRVPEGRVTALGVTGMAETGVVLDGAGRPVTPAIAWHDARGEDEARAIGEAVGAEEFVRRTGLGLRPLCSIAKYAWLRRHHPGAAAGRRWLNVAEWVVHALGGEQLAELSLASRTGWLDLAARDWWPEALAACQAPPGLLPPLAPAGASYGAAAAGLPRLRGAVLTVGGHDHHCGAVGVGAVEDGDVFDSCGTAEAFIAPVVPTMAPETVARLVDIGVNVGWHVVEGRQALLGAQRAGLHLQRFLDLLGVDDTQRRALDDAAAALPDAGGVRVEGFEDERATLTGLGAGPSPAQVWRAALEAMARRSAEILAAVEQGAGPTRRLVVGGGWARSAAVRSTKRAQLGAFDHPRVREPGARGAALLAGVAAGRYPHARALPRPLGRQEAA